MLNQFFGGGGPVDFQLSKNAGYNEPIDMVHGIGPVLQIAEGYTCTSVDINRILHVDRSYVASTWFEPVW